MKYLCLAYGAEEDWNVLPKATQEELLRQDDVLRKRGDLVAAVESPVTVRLNEQQVQTTLGPFASSRVPLAGFSIIEADNLETVIDLVCRTPCAGARGAIEIRPIMARVGQ